VIEPNVKIIPCRIIPFDIGCDIDDNIAKKLHGYLKRRGFKLEDKDQ